jgi:hypothetical protein
MDTTPVAARPNAPVMLPQAFDALYDALRGAQFVNSVTEAKNAFRAKDYADALRLTRTASELYRRAHLHLQHLDAVRDAKNKEEIGKIRAKQAKLQAALALFGEVVGQLEKLAKVQPEKPPPAESPKASSAAASTISAEFREAFLSAKDYKSQFDAVCGHFQAQAVESERDIRLGALYALRNQEKIHLIRCTKREGTSAALEFELVLTGKPLARLLKLGAEGHLHRLLAKPRGESAAKGADSPLAFIDMGTFTQLQTAAQATGLIPNADAIGFVRDNEYRTKKYQEAFDRMEGLFIHLRTAAEQRAQKLRQEEMGYHAGTLKMSPKEWMMKQQREAALTQCIARALRYFAKIQDGLRVLRTQAAQAAEEKASAEQNNKTSRAG